MSADVLTLRFNDDVSPSRHTYLNNMSEDPTPHLAAFMIFRQEHWYSFSSTGWFDSDWEWHAVYAFCFDVVGVWWWWWWWW